MAPVVALEPLQNAVLALAGAVILLSLLIMLQRGFALLVRIRVAKREPILTRLIYEAVHSTPFKPGRLHKLSRFDRQLLRSMLLGLALDLRGDTGEGISRLYRHLGLHRGDLNRLRSWRATVRAHAAADLGVIHVPESMPALLKALNDSDLRVRQAALWAIGRVGQPSTLQGLVRLLGDRNTMVAHRAREVLAERGREVAEAILTYAETTASRSGRLAAIELIGWLRLAAGASLLLTFMSDLDPEVRVKSVKAAAIVGDPVFLDSFQSRLTDASWPVRCQAAKGLSVLGSADSVPRLSEALRDRQWWVRFYAATALAEIGPAGEEALSDALQDPEPLVREMARYLLERGQMVPALP
jgi:HEAT repeat protein